MKARKFEVLATQRAEENVTLQRRVLELEQSIEEQNLQADKLRKSLERVQVFKIVSIFSVTDRHILLLIFPKSHVSFLSLYA